MTAAADPAADEKFFQSDNFVTLRDRNLRAAHKKLTGSEFLVYFGLVQIMDYQCQVKKPIDELQQECNVKRTTLIKALDSLVAMGMVRRLGNKYEGYTYQITQLEDWVERSIRSGTESVLRRTKALAAKVYNKVVQKTDDTKSEQPTSALPPLGGVVLEVDVVQEEQSRNCTAQEVQNPNHPEHEPTFSSLDEKLAAARMRWSAGMWFNDLGEQMVTVNSWTVTASEFMKRSLSSFDYAREACSEGLAMFKAKLEQIKQRNQIKRNGYLFEQN